MTVARPRSGLAVIGAVLLMLACGRASATGLLRHPDIHGDTVVFTYGGDIFAASVSGRDVRRLTETAEEESRPRFSPDGTMIAFSSDRDGNTDVYVMPVVGGEASRLTFHPADDVLIDWLPDGTGLAFRSARSSFSYRFQRLHVVPLAGGLPRVLDLPEAAQADFDDTGSRIAYCRLGNPDLDFKGYRGGAAPDIRIYDFDDHTSELVVDGASIDQDPVWVGRSIYFVSDKADGRTRNLWRYVLDGGRTEQITFSDGRNVRWPAKGTGRIVYEMGGDLYVFSTAEATPSPTRLEIEIPRAEETARAVDPARFRFRGDAALSPDGERVIVCIRGELCLVDTRTGDAEILTRTSGAREHGAAWSSDGRAFAYISDETGEEQIYLRDADGRRPARRLTNVPRLRLGNLLWSPDGSRIGYSDHRSRYHYVDVETGRSETVFFDEFETGDPFVEAAWSPDGRWLAYARRLANRLRAIHLHDLENGRTRQVTEGLSDDFSPCFDADGAYLFWVSDRRINIESLGVGNTGYYYRANPSMIMAASLRAAGAPLLAGGEAAGRKQVKIVIDTDGLEDRAVPLPLDASNYDDLCPVDGGLVFTSRPHGEASSTRLFDVRAWEERPIKDGAGTFRIAADAGVILYEGGGLFVADMGAGPDAEPRPVDCSGLEIRIDPARERVQILDEAWRIQRDLCFDESLNGVDWPAVRATYERCLPDVSNRRDLNHLIEDMYAELGHGHTMIRGGDIPSGRGGDDGILAADLRWDADRGAYRIDRIYPAQTWETEPMSPLDAPGIDVREGDCILAMDGVRLAEDLNPHALLVGKAGEAVVLTLGGRADAPDERTVTVTPVAFCADEDRSARYHDWVRGNMRTVREAGGGRIGYFHVPDTYLPGIESFIRDAYAQVGMDAFIIDARFNAGGYSPSFMIQVLAQTEEFLWKLPHGKAPFTDPEVTWTGPKVCLVNEWTESGGDMLAGIFRQRMDGVVIGRRTTGKLSGARGVHLIDKGVVVYAAAGSVDARGRPVLENVGLVPDIDVINRPEDLIRGRDPQLERAVETLLRELGAGD